MTDAVLQLAVEGFGFTESSARSLSAGPSGDRGHDVPLELSGQLDEGELYRLDTAGVTAQAVRLDDRWVVLAGSEVRRKVVRSAGVIPSMLRAEWLFSHSLVNARGGRYRLTVDKLFESGSAAANFVVGSKGPNLAAWIRIGEPLTLAG